MKCRRIINRILAIILTLFLGVSLGTEAFAEICLDGAILPQSASELRTAVILGSTDLEITFPNGESNGYLIAYSYVPVIVTELAGLDSSELPPYVPDETVNALAVRYGKILISVANVLNLSRKKMDYELSAFGTAPRSTVWTCSPSQRDWRKMLTKLFETAMEDEELGEILPQGADMLFRDALNNMDEIVDALEGLSVQAAYDDGNIYAVRLFNAQQGISYQSYGDLSTVQHDAVVYEKGGEKTILAVSETKAASAGFSGTSVRIISGEGFLGALSDVLRILQK